jgi:hypothetical protein
MKKQTALEWLLQEWQILESQIPPRIIEQAKYLEKEQISEAYRTGVEEDVYSNPLRTGEMYYNHTYL